MVPPRPQSLPLASEPISALSTLPEAEHTHQILLPYAVAPNPTAPVLRPPPNLDAGIVPGHTGSNQWHH